MTSDAYREQLTRYAQLMRIEIAPDAHELQALLLRIQKLAVPIRVNFPERQNPLLGDAMQLIVARFMIDVALTATMIRPFLEKSRDIATCWGVAVEVRDAPTGMTNLEPRAEYHASLQMCLPAHALDLESFAWIINQIVCAYIDLMGVQPLRA